MKTEGLKQALNKYKFDAAFGGARRDEEKSRAKERVYSFRDQFHRWDPKNQRPELWNLYNAKVHKGESIRVFPLSNWTELDVWQYIHLENIPIVPLYFAKERPIVWRDGMMIMVDDDRLPLKPGEKPEMRRVRFRTLGCYPLTGAVDSNATTLPEIIQEMLLTKSSERQGRLIDHDQVGLDGEEEEGRVFLIWEMDGSRAASRCGCASSQSGISHDGAEQPNAVKATVSVRTRMRCQIMCRPEWTLDRNPMRCSTVG